MSGIITTRRALIGGAAATGAGLLLSGCDASSPILDGTDMLNLRAHRLLGGRDALAREFRLDQRSSSFRTNGTRRPGSDAYRRHEATGFVDWRLRIDGLVERPLELSLADLAGMPSRTQVTRHDCVEGWSAIGQWTGIPLGYLLRRAGVRGNARFAALHCADDFSGTPYYESIDLVDAFHPQTILAWGLNGARLPVGNGAPLRLRVERQLGYKHAKYVMRVELRDSLAGLGGGKGGYWEDVSDYEWYAGI
jgi:DMSO/TMAO reductase YedYZ molybdopterin-dependent catalytic subunit